MSPAGPAVREALRRTARRGDLPTRALAAWDRRTGTSRGRSWDDAVAVLLRVPPTTIGVDVFDTVLSRRLLGDAALYRAVGTRLRAQGDWRGTVPEFVQARHVAAQERPEAGLADLYAAPALSGRCAPGAGPAAERDLEVELSVPAPGAAAALPRLRAAGHDICFISDMHLSSADVRGLLTRPGLAVEGDELVVSCEVGASKWSGSLFPRLHRRSDRPVRWHVGNAPWSDVAMAERAGVQAVPVDVAEPSDLQRRMASKGGSAGAAVAGAARLARWNVDPAEPAIAALRETGADVAGQCLSGFLLWVREQCDQAAVAEVAFLARDGELPWRMARAMPADHWDGLGLRYLHGSRRLWSLASAAVVGVVPWLEAGTADDAAFALQGRHALPWRSLLARVGLTPDDVAPFPELARLAPEQPLPAERDLSWRAVLSDPEVVVRIEQRAAEQYARLREHLQAQGLGESRLALVDVGWRGQLAWQVSAVVRGVTGTEPVHLHLGGADVAPDAARADIRRFCFDDSRAPLPFADVVSCVETLTASGAARAHGVERTRDGGVRLVFDAALPQMDSPQRRELWRSAVAVAAALPARSELRAWGMDTGGLAAAVRDVLTTFWLHPSPAHALAGAQLASEVDDAGVDVRPVARPYGLRAGAATSGSRTWRQGSLMLTHAVVRGPLSALLQVRDVGRARRSWGRPAVDGPGSGQQDDGGEQQQ